MSIVKGPGVFFVPASVFNKTTPYKARFTIDPIDATEKLVFTTIVSEDYSFTVNRYGPVVVSSINGSYAPLTVRISYIPLTLPDITNWEASVKVYKPDSILRQPSVPPSIGETLLTGEELRDNSFVDVVVSEAGIKNAWVEITLTYSGVSTADVTIPLKTVTPQFEIPKSMLPAPSVFTVTNLLKFHAQVDATIDPSAQVALSPTPVGFLLKIFRDNVRIHEVNLGEYVTGPISVSFVDNMVAEGTRLYEFVLDDTTGVFARVHAELTGITIAQTPLPPVLNLAFVYDGVNHYGTFTWDPVEEAGVNIRYRIKRTYNGVTTTLFTDIVRVGQTNPDETFRVLESAYFAGPLSALDDPASAVVTIIDGTYTIEAYDATTERGTTTASVYANVANQLPAPEDLRVTNSTYTSVTMAWDPVETQNNTTAYDVYNGETLIAADQTGTSYLFEGLTEGTAYTFGVVAKDTSLFDGNSVKATLNVTTPTETLGVLGEPEITDGETDATVIIDTLDPAEYPDSSIIYQVYLENTLIGQV